MAVELNDRPRHGREVVWRAGDEGVVLLKPDDGQYFALDEVGERIWALCDGTRSAQEITAALELEYDVDAAALRADVLGLLSELANERLLEVD